MKHFLLPALCLLTAASASANPRVGLLIGFGSESDPDMNFQEARACELFHEVEPDGAIIAAGETDRISTTSFDCIWIHIDRCDLGKGNIPEAFGNAATVAALKTFVENGGNLFLSKQATQLLTRIGRIDARFEPNIYADGQGGLGEDRWTVQAQIGYWFINEKDNPNDLHPEQYYDRRGHAIYAGLEVNDEFASETFGLLGRENAEGAAPLWREDHNCMWDLNAYAYTSEGPNTVVKFEQDNKAVVLGQWGHVQDFAVAGIVEFLPEATSRAAESGRIIANGLAAYELAPREGVNYYAGNIKKMTANTLSYLAKTSSGIEDVTVADTEVTREYFNLQGMRVHAENLTPGLYIVRQGDTATKVLVK